MDTLFSPSSQDGDSGEDLPSRSSCASPSRGDLPLAVRMRPGLLEELVGQDHLLTPGSPLRRLAEGGGGVAGPTSAILWGPPGTGKTTLAHVVSAATGRRFVELSAVTAGVKDVRRAMEEARRLRDLQGRTTVLFLDEIHRFTRAQQDALLPGVENRWVVLIAATTENPSFSVVAPLLSRSLLLTLRPLEPADLERLLERAVADPRGLGNTVRLAPEAREHLVRLAGGDARRALTALEAAAGAALSSAGPTEPTEPAGTPPEPADRAADPAPPPTVTLELVERAVDRAAVRYDRSGDQHYDVSSALIKSMRGSDVDAALHYLARMLEAGEDPRFVARRIMICASEDVGMADPTALATAVAAAQAVQLVGMPEARIILSQAVVHLSLAPKSNACCTGIAEAVADVRAGAIGPVPPPLRDAHYSGAGALGHGKGYRYTHDDPAGVVAQQYSPDDLVGRDYYRPTSRGFERELAGRLTRLRTLLRGGRGGASGER